MAASRVHVIKGSVLKCKAGLVCLIMRMRDDYDIEQAHEYPEPHWKTNDPDGVQDAKGSSLKSHTFKDRGEVIW